MKALFHLAAEVQGLFIERRWEFCFIGALAVQRWGEPRLTTDVDISLFTGFGKEAPFIDELLRHYQGRRNDTKEFASKNRVLLLKSPENIGIDISLAALPFEERVIKRASFFEFLPDVKLLTCSAEDLIVLKTFANRGRDWVDVEGILIRRQGKLNFDQIFTELKPLVLLKEEPEILNKLKQKIP